MRPIAVLFTLLLVARAGAQDGGKPKYTLPKDSYRVNGPYERRTDSKLVYDVAFQIKGIAAEASLDEVRDWVVINENGKEAHRFELKKVQARQMTVVLAMDISGSMKRPSKATGKSKMAEAQAAAHVFLSKLHAKTDLGLILFDNQIKLTEPPARDPAKVSEKRQKIGQHIDEAKPQGGTAYLDAAHEALLMLDGVEGQKAVVVMTDGLDLDSKKTIEEVVKLSKDRHIPVYTIGIGDAGWNDPVSTVLVLDHSGSMAGRAGREFFSVGLVCGGPPAEAVSKTKIVAAQEAASRFVELMRPGARATVLPFSSKVERPDDFTDNRVSLKDRIRVLAPEGGTSLYDGTLAGVRTVAAGASRPKERRCVVALTDGIDEDPGSRHRPQDVIDLAKDEKVTVFMLGLGEEDEINKGVMTTIAEKTGGKFFHAQNQQKLYEMFEELSLAIHGDGIDEKALRELADRTGGKYYPAADASELQLLYEQLADALDSTYEVTFVSLNQRNDGTVSAIDLFVEDKTGQKVSVVVDEMGKETGQVLEADIARHGLVVPEVDYLVYLILLALLVGLAVLPAVLRRGAAG